MNLLLMAVLMKPQDGSFFSVISGGATSQRVSAVELPVAPRLSIFRLTAPTALQPASAPAYTANMSIIKYDLNIRFYI